MKGTAEKHISSLVLLYSSEHRASWGLMSTSGFFPPDLPVSRESCQRTICKTLVKLHTRPGIHVLSTLSPCKESQQPDHSPQPGPYSRCDFQHQLGGIWCKQNKQESWFIVIFHPPTSSGGLFLLQCFMLSDCMVTRSFLQE